MEVSGVILRQVPCFSGAGIDKLSSASSFPVIPNSDQNRRVCSKPRKFCRVSTSAFCDIGHLEYYESIRRGEKMEKEKGRKMMSTKKKLKLLKGLSKDLCLFSELGFGIDPEIGLVGEIQGKMISEAAEALLKQLQQVRAEEKELKKKKKQEKAKLKAEGMKTKHDSESSSSESSDSECGEVINMSHLRNESPVQQQQPTLSHEVECSSPQETSCSPVTEAPTKRVEVCMGGKCKKSGGVELMAEFGRIIGDENSVVGCKCMGKCRDGPNVRILNQVNGIDDSVRTPANPLCIGVGLADVGVIVANFFGEDTSLIPVPAI